MSNIPEWSSEFWETLESMPRVHLSKLPTPVLPMHRLGERLARPEIWIKRDDLISFGLGGNKVRGLEFLLADALAQKSEVIVSGAGLQSNHVRATAAAASVYGLGCVAVFWGDAPEQVDGNYRVTRMLGAEAVFTGDPDRESVDPGIERVCADLRRQGRHPYPIPRGGACALGALGHVLAARELHAQCRALEFDPTLILLASGSGGTHAGWMLGSRALGASWKIESVTVSRDPESLRAQVVQLANQASQLLGRDWRFTHDDVIVHGGWIGAGYGIPTPEAAEAIRLVGRTEGVLLDPTYTGKAMAGLLDLLHRQRIPEGPIVFLHTGGEPAFFAGDGQWLG